MKSIINHPDCANLQNDLGSLTHWSSSNIVFNKEKTVLLRIHASSHPIAVNYFLDNQELVPTECHCDLGIVISNDLSWSAHYSRIICKARTLVLNTSFFGLFYHCKDSEITLPLTSKISQLTYCSTTCVCIWRQYLLKDITLLESVQRRSSRWILNDYKLDYKSRMKTLHLLSLMMVYELNNLLFFMKPIQSPSQSFNILDYVSFSLSSTQSFGIKLQHHFSHNNKSRHFFLSCLPQLWNSLSPVDPDLSTSQAILFLKNFFWSQFLMHFDSSNLCTYHFR